jgi:diguanylate cyclase (GGDEF)-like protein
LPLSLVSLLPYIVVTLGIGVFDWSTGSGLSVLSFYVIPIMIATWRLGGAAGLALAGLIAVQWMAVKLLDATRPDDLRGWWLIWNWLQRMGIFFAVWFLVVQIRAVRFRQLRLLSSDPLTGVDTRQVFLRNVGTSLASARQSGQPVALLLIDVDGLRRVNARQGQQRGDLVLLNLARTLWSQAGATDSIGRLGGDEFGLLMTNVDQPGALARVAAIRQNLAQAQASQNDPVTFSTALITAWPAPAVAEDLVQRAEEIAFESFAGASGASVHRTFEG